MATSGQTLNDRINAARYALAGQGLARCVCKATTEEVIGPKKKHLDYLLACTHEPNVSIPQLANLLIERTNHIQWVVVFKALVTVHHLMSYGNERFIQYLASSNYSFELSTFRDKTSARDFSMSTFIRRYSRYINEKALSYRLLAFDFCKIKRGNEGVLRLMPIDRLLKTLPILENQLDALLEFDCSASDLNNGVINACFMLLFRDLIGLFACHNDGIINLLNKIFNLNKKLCREAFDLYKKFLVRMDKVSDFLRVAEVVGIDKEEIPDLRRAPSSLIEALEQHLLNLESNKKILKQSSTSTTSTSTTNNNNNNTITSLGGDPSNLISLSNLSPFSSSSTPKAARPSSPNQSVQSQIATLAAETTPKSLDSGAVDERTLVSFGDAEVRHALEEEARVLSLYGSSEANKSKSSPGQLRFSSSNQPEASAPKSEPDAIKLSPPVAKTKLNSSTSNRQPDPEPIKFDDIFGDADSFTTNVQPTGPNYTSLGNLEGFGNVLQPFTANGKPSNSNANSTLATASTAGIGAASASGAPTLAFTTTIGGTSTAGSGRPAFTSGSSGLSSTGLFKGDLDSTLANLAQNLNFDGLSKPKK